MPKDAVTPVPVSFPRCIVPESAPGDFRIFGWKNRNREFYWWLYKMASRANRSSDVIIIDGSIMEGVRRTYLWVIPFTKTVPIKLSFWDKFFVSTYCMRSLCYTSRLLNLSWLFLGWSNPQECSELCLLVKFCSLCWKHQRWKINTRTASSTYDW